MRSTHSHLTLTSIASSFIRQVSAAVSDRLQGPETKSIAPELPAHLRFDIGDLDIRPQADKRRAPQDLCLLRSL